MTAGTDIVKECLRIAVTYQVYTYLVNLNGSCASWTGRTSYKPE
jgi:hypothetical protein